MWCTDLQFSCRIRHFNLFLLDFSTVWSSVSGGVLLEFAMWPVYGEVFKGKPVFIFGFRGFTEQNYVNETPTMKIR